MEELLSLDPNELDAGMNGDISTALNRMESATAATIIHDKIMFANEALGVLTCTTLYVRDVYAQLCVSFAQSIELWAVELAGYAVADPAVAGTTSRSLVRAVVEPGAKNKVLNFQGANNLQGRTLHADEISDATTRVSIFEPVVYLIIQMIMYYILILNSVLLLIYYKKAAPVESKRVNGNKKAGLPQEGAGSLSLHEGSHFNKGTMAREDSSGGEGLLEEEWQQDLPMEEQSTIRKLSATSFDCDDGMFNVTTTCKDKCSELGGEGCCIGTDACAGFTGTISNDGSCSGVGGTSLQV